LPPVRLGFYEENAQNLLQRCRVGEFVCGQDNDDQYQHAEGCTEWNGDEWASLDLSQEVETSASLDRHYVWRVRLVIKRPRLVIKRPRLVIKRPRLVIKRPRLVIKRPPHVVEMVDYAGRWLLGTLADEIPARIRLYITSC
jgi:hypothetical protein